MGKAGPYELTTPDPVLALARRSLLIAAGAVLAFAPFALFAPTHPGWAFLLQLCWAAVMALAAWGAGRVDDRRGRALLVATSASMGLFCAPIVWTSGGVLSPAFAWMVALPLALTVLFREFRAAVEAGSAGALVAAVVLCVVGPGSPALWALRLAQVVASAILAVIGSRVFAAFRARELEAEAERESAVHALAASEVRRQQTERLAMIGQLATGVSHEVNNPLGALKANVELLLARGAELPSAQRQELLTESLEGALRIEEVVARLQRFARNDWSQPEPLSVREVTAEAVRLHGQAVQTQVPEDLPLIVADRRKLEHALLSVLQNASEAVAASASPRIELSARREGDQVAIEVDDNGPGIPEASLLAIFRPFFTTKPPGHGMGLGLAIAREVLERMGGTVSAENRERGGARVVFRLPIAPATGPRQMAGRAP